MIGQKLAHYEITALLGKGGMGVVYRAHDTKLARDVALKVVPEAFAKDPQRMSRFAREAKVLAVLNHANIAAVYGLENDGETHALVMELVEGETLQERIGRGRIPIDEAARIGLELAKAMEYAHEKGIVHRDLKPANVMLDAEGHVKVLDFGLAKALEDEKTPEDLADSPTLTAVATQAGIILGTAAYMSPEQAAGTGADRRADIWSYGAVLSEMLSGRQQFSGETVSHTLASVLKDEPNWNEFSPRIPPRIVELLRRCLEKHPKQRLQAIGEARVMWESYLADPQSFAAPAGTRTSGIAPAATRGKILPWAVAALALAALVFVYVRGSAPTPNQATTLRLTIPIDGGTSFLENQASPPVISPDGHLIAYGMTDDEGVDQLWIRPIDSFDTRPLEGTTGARYPFWSPDSRHLGFFLGGRLRRIEIATGRIQTIGGERAFLARGASWTPNDQILFAPNSNSGIWVVDAGGGSARQITTPDPNVADSSHRWPHALPDGEHFLFLVWTNDADALVEHGGVFVASLDGTGEPRRIVSDASSVVYTQSGHLLVMDERNLVAIPFDADELEINGDAFVVADEVLVNRNNGHASFSASENGTLVFARGLEAIPTSSFFWANRDGDLSETPVEAGMMFSHIRLSPDATRAAITSPGPTGDPEVWVLDLLRGVRTRLTPSAPYTFERPIWSPAGDRILYVSAKVGTWDLYTRNADGSGQEELFLQTEFDKVASDWNGDHVLYWSEISGFAGSMFAIHDTSTGESTTIFEQVGTPRPRFSPDGKFITYDSSESGRSEIVIHQVDGGARWQVSTSGGRFAHWSADGREIIYLDPRRRVMAVEVTVDDAGLALGQPEELFQIVQNVVAWDITGDHSRILLATRPELASEPLHVILNWDAR